MIQAVQTGDPEIVGFMARRAAQVASNTATHWAVPTSTRVAHYNQGVRIVGYGASLKAITDYLPTMPITVFYTPSGVLGELERVQRELERLQDGWAGPGTVAPSERTKADTERLLSMFSEIERAPEVEVDEDVGHVTLRWSGAVTLALVLRGDGKVLVVNTKVGDRPEVTSKSFDVLKDEASFIRYVMSSAGEALSGT